MAKKKKEIVLLCTYGRGENAKAPGSVIKLPEETAEALIKAGHARNPGAESAASSDRIKDLEAQLAQQGQKFTEMLNEAKAYAEGLEALLKKNNIPLPRSDSEEKDTDKA